MYKTLSRLTSALPNCVQIVGGLDQLKPNPLIRSHRVDLLFRKCPVPCLLEFNCVFYDRTIKGSGSSVDDRFG